VGALEPEYAGIKRIVTDLLGTSLEWQFVRAIVLIFAVGAVLRLIPLRLNGQKRRSAPPDYLTLLAGIAGVALLAVACTTVIDHSHRNRPLSAAIAKKAWAWGAAEATADLSTPYIGVFEPGATASYTTVRKFASETGQPVSISLYYSGWNDPFQVNMATWARQSGGMPFVQMLPYHLSVARIANGQYDAYLRSFASAVRTYQHAVLIGFGPEMNGNWYGWANGRTEPSVYIAAWRHIVNVFRAERANNVVWVWTVNSINASRAPLRQWWPGASYVTWIGIDGYYYRPTDTFNSVFGTTIQEIRTFTSKQVLISETAIGPNSAKESQMNGLFQGVQRYHLLGLVWFDQAQNNPPYHQDWRLADDRERLAMFRKDAAAIGS
jgi:mannan endo-1,4-beta-mannosidase